MKKQLREFWNSDPTKTMYGYDQDVISNMQEIQYPGNVISQKLDIIYVNIDEIQDEPAPTNVVTNSNDGRVIAITLGVCGAISAILLIIVGCVIFM